MYIKKALLFIIIAAGLKSCSDPWQELLDPELSKWDTYLGFKHDTAYDGNAPLDSFGNPLKPVGYNYDPDSTFSIVYLNDEMALRIKGEYYGAIFTEEEFSNYHLKLKLKWGDKKWPPRLDKEKDSGLLYHSNGPSGLDHWRAWMASHEFQIMENHMGDYWGIVNTMMDIRAEYDSTHKSSFAALGESFIQIGGGSIYGGMCNAASFHPPPSDEWIALELICYEDKSLHILENQIVMVLKNSRQNINGEITPLTSGKIQIQSEAAEVFYKDITIRKIKKLPDNYVSYFN